MSKTMALSICRANRAFLQAFLSCSADVLICKAHAFHRGIWPCARVYRFPLSPYIVIIDEKAKGKSFDFKLYAIWEL